MLALTGDDLTNLGIVQAVHLLRPGLPVIAWSKDRDLAQGMRDFGASAVLNPYDRFGMYLTLGLRRPITLQLMFWLMAPLGTPLTDKSHGIPRGTWLRVRPQTARSGRGKDPHHHEQLRHPGGPP